MSKYSGGGNGGGAYFLAMVGAIIFYVQRADGFWPIVAAILKGILWPAFVVYGLLQHIT